MHSNTHTQMHTHTHTDTHTQTHTHIHAHTCAHTLVMPCKKNINVIQHDVNIKCVYVLV